MKIALEILKYIEKNNIDHIYGIPAGTISPIMDAINDTNLKAIIAKNEGGAAFMAARHASVTKKLSVCIGAGGPGVDNMISGVADAFRAKAPVLIITGCVNRWQMGKGALQELDAQDILKPITKYSKTILKEDEVLSELEKAIRLAYTVPMGPVHLAIPLDIQMLDNLNTIPTETYTQPIFTKENNNGSIEEALEKACGIINKHENGMILVGKGGRGFGAEITELSKRINWPIITSPEGKGVIAGDYSLNYGSFGFASSDASTKYINDESTTAILVIGSTLGETATANFSESLFKGKVSIHIDWDKKELGKVYDTDVTICEDFKVALPYILANTEEKESNRSIPELNNPTTYTNTAVSLKEFIIKLPEHMPKDTYYLCDMGEFMNFAFKYLNVPEEGDFECNLNYAAMGHAIGGAAGVQMAHPERNVAVIAGDGCFFMNGNELLTAKEYNMPIIYIIVNNAMLGFVEHGHKALFNRAVEGFIQERINIADVVKACGIDSMQVTDIADMDKIGKFLQSGNGPKVIEVITDGSEPSPNGDRLKSLANK